MRPRPAAAAAIAVALTCAGCGGGDSTPRRPAASAPSTATERAPATERARPSAPALEPARCPSGAGNCASATGRVVYVEKVDPDGDGDAHFVLFGGNVTGRGLSVIDVRRGLRPDPLPRVGDQVTAAGPVYRGSHGQRQIQADVVRVRRR